jgi:hypothetical protein
MCQGNRCRAAERNRKVNGPMTEEAQLMAFSASIATKLDREYPRAHRNVPIMDETSDEFSSGYHLPELFLSNENPAIEEPKGLRRLKLTLVRGGLQRSTRACDKSRKTNRHQTSGGEIELRRLVRSTKWYIQDANPPPNITTSFWLACHSDGSRTGTKQSLSNQH